MHTNHAYFWLTLIIWLKNNVATLFAVPQQGGPALDLGFLKFGVDIANGLAMRKDVDINTPLFKFQKTSEIGFGEPMARADDSSSSSSEEGSFEVQTQRSKREIKDDKSKKSGYFERKKRAPCFGTYGGMGGSGTSVTAAPDVDETEAARRRVARKVIQRARKNAAGKSKSKGSGRRRRQTEIENPNNGIQTQNAGKNIGDHIESAMQKVRTFWESIVETTKRFTQAVGKTFTASTNSSGS